MAQYHKNGWAPVEWAHHPPEVKAAIRAAGFRPAIKECFANSQRLLVATCRLDASEKPAQPGFTYHEGIVASRVGLPVMHAWLTLGAAGSEKIVDLTLHGAEILSSYSVPWYLVTEAMLRTGQYGPVYHDRLKWMLGAAIWGARLGDVTGLDDDALHAKADLLVRQQKETAHQFLQG